LFFKKSINAFCAIHLVGEKFECDEGKDGRF
jgi:hypothetical protein